MSVSYPLRQQWLGNIRGDLLSGAVVALALIPEAIAFSIIAGVDPKVGLYASFCIAVVTAIAGGRPGMISAATGAMALVMVDLVRDHGLQYLLAATILAGLLQIVAGALTQQVRGDDLVARFGGEEFVLLLRTDLASAESIAQRMAAIRGKCAIVELPEGGVEVSLEVPIS